MFSNTPLVTKGHQSLVNMMTLPGMNMVAHLASQLCALGSQMC